MTYLKLKQVRISSIQLSLLSLAVRGQPAQKAIALEDLGFENRFKYGKSNRDCDYFNPIRDRLGEGILNPKS